MSNAGMNWVDTSALKLRFIDPILIEVDGDRSDLASNGCEVVDVQGLPDGSVITILHCPGGSLPCPTSRAMGICYLPEV